MPFNWDATWAEQSVAPSTPGTGKWKLYPKSDGWYYLDDAGTETKIGFGGANMVGAASSADNALVRFDGTGGKTAQNSGILLDDSNNMTFPDSQLIRPLLKDVAEVVVTEAASGSTETIDLEAGNVKDLTLSADCTLTFSNPPASGRAGSFTLIVRQDGTGGWELTYPASVVWAGGTEPTLSSAISAVDILTFMTLDNGTTWFGFLAGLAFS